MSMLIIQSLINGILMGGIYALYSAGFSLIFGVMGVVNIAHGDLVMLGAFITYWMFVSMGLDPFLTLPFSVLGLFMLGYLMQRLAINRVVGAPPIMSYILTFGMHLMISNLALVAWTADPRTVTTAYSGANFAFLGLTVPWIKLITFFISVGVIGLLYWLLHHSQMGRAIQATAQDREMARLTGIKVDRIYALTFGLGAAITGLAGSMLVTFRDVDPGMGLPYTIIAFCVVVLGGMGYIPGALIGGLILGIVGSVSTMVFTAGWSIAITFSLLYLMLLFRPAGITGKGIVE
jgi:branched-chain amino acid transport system permease protein